MTPTLVLIGLAGLGGKSPFSTSERIPHKRTSKPEGQAAKPFRYCARLVFFVPVNVGADIGNATHAARIIQN